MRQIAKAASLIALACASIALCVRIALSDDIGSQPVEFEFVEDVVVEESPDQILELVGERYLGTVETSFWSSFDAKAGPRGLLEKVADALSCTIDVNRESHRGDTWTALVKGHDVIAIEYRSARRTWRAMRGITSDTYADFYDPSGQRLCGLFRKTPVRYERVTSAFALQRYHPIRQVMRPHLGIDYAAPQGTPVVALGDGIIEERGFAPEAGNLIEIRHEQGYVSKYLHLSRFNLFLNKGAPVKRGQIIGYVGATGTATGPHLHFELIKKDKIQKYFSNKPTQNSFKN